jgi:hypothetical protein
MKRTITLLRKVLVMSARRERSRYVLITVVSGRELRPKRHSLQCCETFSKGVNSTTSMFYLRSHSSSPTRTQANRSQKEDAIQWIALSLKRALNKWNRIDPQTNAMCQYLNLRYLAKETDWARNLWYLRWGITKQFDEAGTKPQKGPRISRVEMKWIQDQHALEFQVEHCAFVWIQHPIPSLKNVGSKSRVN